MITRHNALAKQLISAAKAKECLVGVSGGWNIGHTFNGACGGWIFFASQLSVELGRTFIMRMGYPEALISNTQPEIVLDIILQEAERQLASQLNKGNHYEHKPDA